jgi:hypothetical protein
MTDRMSPAANFFPPAAAAHSLLQLTLSRLPPLFHCSQVQLGRSRHAS